MNAQVAIIGCGVSGLTTGIVLREAGYDAHIVTTDWPQQTVSAKAAAIWFPFQIGPVVEANVWSKIAYSKFVELSAQANTGIVMRPLLELIADESDAWWKDALPASAIRRAEPHEIPAGFSMGYRMEVPIIETPIYVQWLLDRFQALGGTVTMQSIHNIHAFATDFPATINCTGLASRELMGDDALYPIRGQIVKVAPHPDVISMSADMQLWGSETDLAYLIPRRDCIVLGGNALPYNAGLAVDEAATLGILSRCAKLDARISELPILSVEVGLRPGRKEIRLAREGAIIHNYGHGGGGYTVSWGCAQAVLEILRGFLSADEAMQG